MADEPQLGEQARDDGQEEGAAPWPWHRLYSTVLSQPAAPNDIEVMSVPASLLRRVGEASVVRPHHLKACVTRGNPSSDWPRGSDSVWLHRLYSTFRGMNWELAEIGREPSGSEYLEATQSLLSLWMGSAWPDLDPESREGRSQLQLLGSLRTEPLLVGEASAPRGRSYLSWAGASLFGVAITSTDGVPQLVLVGVAGAMIILPRTLGTLDDLLAKRIESWGHLEE